VELQLRKVRIVKRQHLDAVQVLYSDLHQIVNGRRVQVVGIGDLGERTDQSRQLSQKNKTLDCKGFMSATHLDGPLRAATLGIMTLLLCFVCRLRWVSQIRPVPRHPKQGVLA